MSVRSFSSVSEDFASASGEANFLVLASHSQLRPLVLASSSLALHGFSDADFAGVGWIGSPLLGLASFWVLLWCLGLLANIQVLLNPLPRQSTLPLLVVAFSSFGFHTP
jgi:hypothetical protein